MTVPIQQVGTVGLRKDQETQNQQATGQNLYSTSQPPQPMRPTAPPHRSTTKAGRQREMLEREGFHFEQWLGAGVQIRELEASLCQLFWDLG